MKSKIDGTDLKCKLDQKKVDKILAALKECNMAEIEQMAMIMAPRIAAVHYDEPRSEGEQKQNALSAANHAVMLLQDLQGKP